MKLPKLLKRGDSDDEDDDDLDEGFDDLDDMDDIADLDDFDGEPGDDLDDMTAGGSADNIDDGAGGGSFDDGIRDDDADIDDPLDDPLDDGDGDDGGDDDIQDFDDDDDFDDDFDDDDYDDDDEDEGGEGGGKRTLMFAAIAGVVLLLGIAGGVGWWMMSGPDEAETAVATENREPPKDTDTRVSLAMPSKGGSLNALKDDESPVPASTALTPPPAAAVTPATEPSAPPQTAADAAPAAAPTPAVTAGQAGLNALLGGNQGPGQGIVIPAAIPQAYAGIPSQQGEQLSTKPVKALLEQKDGLPGPLPRAHKDGRRPMDAYAKPFDPADARPRLALLVTDLGLSRAGTMAAIRKLPGAVSLMFNPYARDLEDWVLRARLAGHEVFIGLPMESENFPVEDAGPLSLDSRIQVKENMVRLEQVLSKMTSYVGVVSMFGSKFKRAEGQLKPILTTIRDRGLMFVDGAPGRSAVGRIAAELNLPKAAVDVILDRDPASGAISRRLADLEAAIRTKGTAIASSRAYPSAVRSITKWAAGLKEKNLNLVPVSAIADKQFVE